MVISCCFVGCGLVNTLHKLLFCRLWVLKYLKFAGPSAQSVLDPQYGPVYCLFFPLPYPSPGGPGAQKKDSQKWAWAFVLLLFFDRVFNMVLDSFWDPLGLHLGSPFGPFGCSSCPKLGRRRVSKHIFHPRCDFEKLVVKPILFQHFWLSRWRPKVPSSSQDAPGRSSRGTFSMLKTLIDFGPSWTRFWVLFGILLGPQTPPRVLGILDPFGRRKRAEPKAGPKRPQETSKRPPRAPRRAPRGPKRPPRDHQERPRAPPKHP